MKVSNSDFLIIDYLYSKGINPVYKKGGELVYFSPLKQERTPSFCVSISKNKFNDFSTGERGDVFRLVMLLEKVGFKESIELLDRQPKQTTFSFSGKKEVSKIEIVNVVPITKEVLKQYVKKRGIDFGLASIYLSEIHYLVNGKIWFALGFKNDSNGYELRNTLSFKSKTVNDITTIKADSKRLSLFEGFFDFLSALQYYKLEKPNNDTIVLNSISNLEKVIKVLGRYSHIYSFLDNDEAGVKAFNKLSERSINVENYSLKLFPKYKDFNGMLIKALK